jgi:Ca-activated chloride channel family protein
LDYNILGELLAHVEVGIIEDGTAIGLAIANAVDRLKNSKAKSKVAILLTDGENNKWEIEPITAARAAAVMNIKIYTIGMGSTDAGVPIPVETVFGKDYIRVDGKLVLTKLDEDTLRTIASETSARYFRATDEKKLSEIYKEISQLETTKLNLKRYIRHNELTAYFLLPAAILLLLEIILANTRFRKIP